MLNYEYVIIGAGISGCCVAYELTQHSNSVLLLDKNSDLALGASGAAGAFLSPLLGKPNLFKDLVTKSLKYSTQFYQQNFASNINNCGTTRIPQNKQDAEKFNDYIPYMDFEYTKEDDGYFFAVGSVVDSFKMCQNIIKSSNKLETKFDYNVSDVMYQDGKWIINNEFTATNIIFTTGVMFR